MANSTVKIPFSASVQGKGIKVVATATLGTTIHVTGVDLYTVAFDSPIIKAYNGHTVDVVLTIEYGGVAVPDNNIVQTIPFKQGQWLILDGTDILAGSGSAGLTISAFASVANVIVLTGSVFRTTV